MTPIDTTNFLLSLASALASLAPTVFTLGGGVGGTTAGNLYVLTAVEAKALNPYIVLRPFGGPPPSELLPIDQISVQAMTNAKNQTVGLQLARKFYELFYHADAQGNKRPRAAWVIPALKPGDDGALIADPDLSAGGGGYEVRVLVMGSPPGLIGRDPQTGDFAMGFNFDVKYSLASAGV